MIKEYLRKKSISYKEITRPSGVQALYPCPKCGQNKFAVSLESGAFQCYRKNECGFSGSWFDLQKFYGDEPVNNKNNYFIADKKTYKKPQVKAQNPKGEALEWLNKRGFKNDIIKYFRIGITDAGDVMLPSFRDGALVNIKYRSIKTKKFWNEKDTEPVLFGMDNITSSTLYITEGHFDTIAAKHYEIDSVSVPNGTSDLSWISACWEWLEKFTRIYLIFDNDSAGQDNILNIAERLGKHRCYNVVLPMKDMNECLLNGISKQDIQDCILSAREFTHSDIVYADFFADAIVASYKQKEYDGLTTGISGLDGILKGWREKEVTLWTGNNGSGKSTMINWVILNNLLIDSVCCIASLEMYAVKYLRWLITQHYKHIPSEDEVFKFLFEYGGKLLVFNSTKATSPDRLFDAFSFAAKKYGVKHFFIDSLMKVRFKTREEYKEQKDFCSDLSDFAKEHRAHVHLVAHPRKGESDDKRPDKVDVAGSGHITDLVDNVLVMWRPEEDMGFSNMLAVKKNREFGKHGNVYFKFDEQTKVFTEIDGTMKKSKKKNPEYFFD